MYKELLAKAFSLYIYSQNAHWIVSKQSFMSDHELFKKMYESTNSLIDTIGEKTMGMTGDESLVKLPDVMKISYSVLKDLAYNKQENIKYFQEYLKLEQDFCKLCEECEKKPEYSLGVRNMLADFADASEGRQYLIKQRIGSGIVKAPVM